MKAFHIVILYSIDIEIKFIYIIDLGYDGFQTTVCLITKWTILIIKNTRHNDDTY
jgi:hypothetical protein